LDVFFELPEQWVCVEVKGKQSPKQDILRGIFQCVKYKAVLEARCHYQQNGGKLPRVRVVLVLGSGLPQQTEALSLYILRLRRLFQKLLHHVAVDIGQPEMPSLELECQFRVIDTETPQDGRVEIVDIHRVPDHVVAVVVCLTVGQTPANTSARHPDTEAPRMMIAAIVILRQRSLRIHRAPEFSAPNDKCVL